jgi:hypothetical protein
MPATPQRGDFVRVRTRRWLVEDERSAGDGLTALRLACVDDDAQGEVVEVLWDAATIPDWTGSPAALKTIGIVLVKALAASGAAVPPAAMTATQRRTKSAANSGSRLKSFCGQRNSIATFVSTILNCSAAKAWKGAHNSMQVVA